MSPSSFRTLLATLVLAAAANAQERTGPFHLTRVAVDDPAAVVRLATLDLDFVCCHGPHAGAREVEIVATDDELARIRAAGFDYTVQIRDLEAHHEAEAQKWGPFPDTLTPPLGQGAMGGHWTFDQCVAILDQFAVDFPAICSQKVSLGQTAEGRDLWMVKISDNVGVDENEPEVLFDALHHAREPLSMETTVNFMNHLLENYGTDPEVTYIVDNRELYFVPVVNPDGYEYNRANNPNGGGQWRKNRNGPGVDLNRNYASFFASPGGSSGSPSSSTYRGPSAFSELETQAMETFTLSRDFVQVVSAHSYTDVLLTPYGYQVNVPPNWDTYSKVANVAKEETGITHGSFSSLLGYLGSGTAQDHHHQAHGALAWTPELGRSNEGQFWPNPANTVSIATRHRNMFQKIALLSGPNLVDGEIILMSDGSLGSAARIGMLGHRNAQGLLAASSGTANIPVPGVSGVFLLDPGAAVWLAPQTFPSSGYLTLDFQIPANPSLSGGVVHWQLLHVFNGQLTFGNRATLTLM